VTGGSNPLATLSAAITPCSERQLQRDGFGYRQDGDTGTSTAVPVSVANVAPTVGTPTVSPTAASEGTAASFTVSGAFTDPAGALDQPFSAVIHWGDGSTDTATVTGGSNPFSYAFSGNHTYAQSGSYNVTVSVSDKDGDSGTSAAVTVSVANVAPTVARRQSARRLRARGPPLASP